MLNAGQILDKLDDNDSVNNHEFMYELKSMYSNFTSLDCSKIVRKISEIISDENFGDFFHIIMNGFNNKNDYIRKTSVLAFFRVYLKGVSSFNIHDYKDYILEMFDNEENYIVFSNLCSILSEYFYMNGNQPLFELDFDRHVRKILKFIGKGYGFSLFYLVNFLFLYIPTNDEIDIILRSLGRNNNVMISVMTSLIRLKMHLCMLKYSTIEHSVPELSQCLLTAYNNCSFYELKYVLIKLLRDVFIMFPGVVFKPEAFYCDQRFPFYLKNECIEILLAIMLKFSNSKHLCCSISSLMCYVKHNNENFTRRIIKMISILTIKFPDLLASSLIALDKLLSSGRNYVVSEVTISVSYLIRNYGDDLSLRNLSISLLKNIFVINEIRSKIAIIRIFCRYFEHLDNSDELFTFIYNNYKSEESPELLESLLLCVVKYVSYDIYNEMKLNILNEFINFAINQKFSIFLMNSAYLYFNILSNIGEAAKGLFGITSPIDPESYITQRCSQEVFVNDFCKLSSLGREDFCVNDYLLSLEECLDM